MVPIDDIASAISASFNATGQVDGNIAPSMTEKR
jgi:hypothetical protein